VDPIWTGLLELLRNDGSRPRLRLLVDQLVFLSRTQGTLRVCADVDRLRDWRREGALAELEGGVAEASDGALALAMLPTRDALAVDPTQTLQSFIPGPANQAARGRLDSLIEHAGSYPGLLRICGPAGSGKTHVLLAIANGIAVRAPHRRVLCVDADDLSLALASALRRDSLEPFRTTLTSADVLLLDAVDRLAGKEETQTELLASLDPVLARPGLVVLAIRDPEALSGLLPELRSRIAESAALDLSPPRFETRVAIAMDRAASWELDASPEIAALLVQHSGDDLRRLDVMLTRLAAHPDCSRALSDSDLLRGILGEAVRRPVPLSTELVLDLVTRHFGVKGTELRAQTRTPRISTPRQIAMYLLREHCDLSYPQIGRVLKRHHTTVMHGYQRIAGQRDHNPGMSATVAVLEKELSRLREREG
jgi:chromosomal replication initiator protein